MITVDPRRTLQGEVNVRVEVEILELAETRFYWKLPHERPVMARGPFVNGAAALADAEAKCRAVMRKFKS